MKKAILTFLALGAVVSSYAQGYLGFSNGNTTLVTTNSTQDYLGNQLSGGTSGVTPGSGVAPQGYYYALLYQAYSGSTAANNMNSLTSEGWLWSGDYATNALGGGRFTGGTDVAVAGITAGGNYQFVVVGWSSNEGGANWATVANELATGIWNNANGFAGISSVGVVTGVAGAPPSTPSTLFGSSPAISTGFSLYDVPVTIIPEPGTMALAGLGGAALLLFRRKK